MHSFENLLSHYVLKEAISLKNAKKKMLSKKYSGAYNNRLNNVFDNKHRIFLPLTIDYTNIDSPLMKKIDSFLYDDYNYRIPDMENYIKGLAYKFIGKTENYSYGSNIIKDLDMKNPVKIGKLLQKYEKDDEIEVTHRVNGNKTTKKITGKPLLHEFKNDPIRAANGEFVIVISRHPYDIAGSSTDRSWTSCMDLGFERINYPKTKQNTGVNKKYIQKDIEEGTLVAYVVTKNEIYEGPNGEVKVRLRKPLSRILMKPHESNVGKVYSIGQMYGSKYPEFYQKVKEWISKTLNNKLIGDQRVNPNKKLYKDADTPVGFNFGGNDIAEEVLNIKFGWQNEEELQKQLITFEADGDNVVDLSINIRFEFGEDIVRPFNELNDFSQRDIKNIYSPIEKALASVFYDELHIKSYSRIDPIVEIISHGDGIDINLKIRMIVYSEDDKYIDDDYIYQILENELDNFRLFNYKNLKNKLYKICKEYDWSAEQDRHKNEIIKALNNYQKTIEIMTPKSPNIELLKYMKVFKPEIFTKDKLTDQSTMKQYIDFYNKVYNILSYVNTAKNTIEQNLSTYIKHDENYVEKKYSMTHDYFLSNYGVDLNQFKNVMEHEWRAKVLIELRNSDIQGEDYELLLDIQDIIQKVIRVIRYLIGYMGEVKI